MLEGQYIDRKRAPRTTICAFLAFLRAFRLRPAASYYYFSFCCLLAQNVEMQNERQVAEKRRTRIFFLLLLLLHGRGLPACQE